MFDLLKFSCVCFFITGWALTGSCLKVPPKWWNNRHFPHTPSHETSSEFPVSFLRKRGQSTDIRLPKEVVVKIWPFPRLWERRMRVRRMKPGGAICDVFTKCGIGRTPTFLSDFSIHIIEAPFNTFEIASTEFETHCESLYFDNFQFVKSAQQLRPTFGLVLVFNISRSDYTGRPALRTSACKRFKNFAKHWR